MKNKKVLPTILFVLMCLTFSQSHADSSANASLTNSPKSTQIQLEKQLMIEKIRALEPTLSKELERDLRGSYCYEASVILQRLLRENKVETVLVEAKIADDPHYYLIIPNYFGSDEHLYIDPTILQFSPRAPEYKDKSKMFIGSRSKLEGFVNENKINDYMGKIYKLIQKEDADFMTEYLASKKYDKRRPITEGYGIEGSGSPQP